MRDQSMNNFDLEKIIYDLTQLRLSEIESGVEKQIKENIKKLIEKEAQIEEKIFETAEQDSLSNEDIAEILTEFTNKLDDLGIRYCPEMPRYAKIDRIAQEKKTAAGVFTYAKHNGKIVVLLAKRDDDPGWECFGGKSDMTDEFLHIAAAREVYEESSEIFTHTSSSLLNAPFHDFITEKEGSPFVFRLYFRPQPYTDAAKFQDKEHTEYRWVTIDELLKGLEQKTEVNGKETATITSGHMTFTLYPDFYQVMQQWQVKENLERLKDNKQLKKTHTQGSKETTKPEKVSRRSRSPQERAWEVKNTVAKHLAVMKEIKEKNKIAPEEKATDQQFESQSELHLRATLGSDYKENDLPANVATMISSIAGSMLTDEEKKKLVENCVRLILEEKKAGPNHLFFYHACPDKIAFAYDVYSAIHTYMQANPTWHAFRAANEHFKYFADVEKFIDHYSKNKKESISNYAVGYNEVGLSTNGALFGSHQTAGSCTLLYFLDNRAARDINLSELLKDVLSDAGFPSAYIKPLTDLYENHYKSTRGILYQIGMPATLADQLAYAASSGGPLNPYGGSYQPSAVFAKLKEDLDSKDEKRIKSARGYLVDMQMRLMVPPHQPLSVNRITSNDLSSDPSQTKKEINSNDDVIHDLVYEVLLNANKDSLHETAPATRLMSLHMEKNKLPTKKNVSKAGLLRAVQAGQYDLVRRYLEDNVNLREYAVSVSITEGDADLAKMINDIDPALKNKEIELPTSYFESSGNTNKKASAFVWILEVGVSQNLMMTAYFGENWDTLINASHHPYLRKIVGALPPEKRLSFAKNSIPKDDAGTKVLKDVLQHFTESEKTDIMLNFLEAFKNDPVKLDNYINQISFLDLFEPHKKAFKPIIDYLFNNNLDSLISPKSFAKLITKGEEEKNQLDTAKRYFDRNLAAFKEISDVDEIMKVISKEEMQIFVAHILGNKNVSIKLKQLARSSLTQYSSIILLAQQALSQEKFEEVTNNLLTLDKLALIKHCIEAKSNIIENHIDQFYKIVNDLSPKDRAPFVWWLIKQKTQNDSVKKEALDWLKDYVPSIRLAEAIKRGDGLGIFFVLESVKNSNFIHEKVPIDYFAENEKLVTFFELIVMQKTDKSVKTDLLTHCYGDDWQNSVPVDQIKGYVKKIDSLEGFRDFLSLLNASNTKLICDSHPKYLNDWLDDLLSNKFVAPGEDIFEKLFTGLSEEQSKIVLEAVISDIDEKILEKIKTQNDFLMVISKLKYCFSPTQKLVAKKLFETIGNCFIKQPNFFQKVEDCIEIINQSKSIAEPNIFFNLFKHKLLPKIDQVNQVNALLDYSLLSDPECLEVIDYLKEHPNQVLKSADDCCKIYSNNHKYKNKIYEAFKEHFSFNANHLENFIKFCNVLNAAHKKDFIAFNQIKLMGLVTSINDFEKISRYLSPEQLVDFYNAKKEEFIKNYDRNNMFDLMKILPVAQCQDFLDGLVEKKVVIINSIYDIHGFKNLEPEKQKIIYNAIKQSLYELTKTNFSEFCQVLKYLSEEYSIHFLELNKARMVGLISNQEDYERIEKELPKNIHVNMQGILVDYADNFLSEYKSRYPDPKPKKGLRLFDKKSPETFLSRLENAENSLQRYYLIKQYIQMRDEKVKEVERVLMVSDAIMQKPRHS